MSIICPLCQSQLQREDKRWRCENLHSFDIAKQGYCNLLPVQHKRSKSPGDDNDMVLARKAFLALGHYAPLSQAIVKHLKTQFNTHQLQLLDAGCGEGYYTNEVAKHFEQSGLQVDITGIDISKYAVKEAAKLNKQIKWFVANSKQLPLNNHSQDVLLSLFAPLQAKEFSRCLKNNGCLLVASTGEQHLIELRERLYDKVNSQVFEPIEHLKSDFQLSLKQSIQFKFSLNSRLEKKQLLTMTPHYWKSTPQRQKQFLNDQAITLSADITLNLFHRKP